MAKTNNGANLGFEAKLWEAADKLRGHMDASEYKHVVLGLIFLKYISDAFQAKYDDLNARRDRDYTDPEDRDEYAAANIFWVPKEARWEKLRAAARQPAIGKMIDDAMAAIEKENPKLKGVLAKNYARPTLDKRRLGELIDIISGINLKPSPGLRPPSPNGRGAGGEGDSHRFSMDILGRVYEYFLGRFAAKEGKGGGEFYTPQCVVKLLVRMIEPYQGRVYDPCCGSGGMFVQSERFVEEHGGRKGDIAIYGQESNPTTWRLAMMNLAIRGIDANLGGEPGDSFHRDLHKDLRADFLLANPPFNMSDWGGDRLHEDVRWAFGIPPANNANYAWIQHFIHHLSPKGVAGFVMANGSMSSNTSNEGVIRKAMIEADLVDCMIAMPGQLFYTTQIPVCLWFISRDKSGKPSPGLRPPSPSGRGAGGEGCRSRKGETLFIDARKMGSLIDRVHRELSEEDIARIAATYHSWRTCGPHPACGHPLPGGEGKDGPPSTYGRGDGGEGIYEDIPGFCKSATVKEIEDNGFVLTPGRYVGAAPVEDDGIPFEEKMTELTTRLYQQFAESRKLEEAIRKNMEKLGYGE